MKWIRIHSLLIHCDVSQPLLWSERSDLDLSFHVILLEGFGIKFGKKIL